MAKQQYYSWEMEYYAKEIAQVPMIWPDFFPLRSVLPLRVTIAAGCDPSLIKGLYRAVWRDNKDISDPQILSDILTQNGFPSERLLEEANSQPIKDQLFTNTDRAVVKGICGAPTFQVNDGPLIWGQDRLNVVADMLCGWTDGSDVVSKL
jgi:2-hydroxychromene-2-carboxylate isomerase